MKKFKHDSSFLSLLLCVLHLMKSIQGAPDDTDSSPSKIVNAQVPLTGSTTIKVRVPSEYRPPPHFQSRLPNRPMYPTSFPTSALNPTTENFNRGLRTMDRSSLRRFTGTGSHYGSSPQSFSFWTTSDGTIIRPKNTPSPPTLFSAYRTSDQGFQGQGMGQAQDRMAQGQPFSTILRPGIRREYMVGDDPRKGQSGSKLGISRPLVNVTNGQIVNETNIEAFSTTPFALTTDSITSSEAEGSVNSEIEKEDEDEEKEESKLANPFSPSLITTMLTNSDSLTDRLKEALNLTTPALRPPYFTKDQTKMIKNYNETVKRASPSPSLEYVSGFNTNHMEGSEVSNHYNSSTYIPSSDFSITSNGTFVETNPNSGSEIPTNYSTRKYTSLSINHHPSWMGGNLGEESRIPEIEASTLTGNFEYRSTSNDQSTNINEDIVVSDSNKQGSSFNTENINDDYTNLTPLYTLDKTSTNNLRTNDSMIEIITENRPSSPIIFTQASNIGLEQITRTIPPESTMISSSITSENLTSTPMVTESITSSMLEELSETNVTQLNEPTEMINSTLETTESTTSETDLLDKILKKKTSKFDIDMTKTTFEQTSDETSTKETTLMTDDNGFISETESNTEATTIPTMTTITTTAKDTMTPEYKPKSFRTEFKDNLLFLVFKHHDFDVLDWTYDKEKKFRMALCDIMNEDYSDQIRPENIFYVKPCPLIGEDRVTITIGMEDNSQGFLPGVDLEKYLGKNHSNIGYKLSQEIGLNLTCVTYHPQRQKSCMHGEAKTANIELIMIIFIIAFVSCACILASLLLTFFKRKGSSGGSYSSNVNRSNRAPAMLRHATNREALNGVDLHVASDILRDEGYTYANCMKMQGRPERYLDDGHVVPKEQWSTILDNNNQHQTKL